MLYIWYFVQAILALILIFPVLSYIIYLLKPKSQPLADNTPNNDYGIIVTAYKFTGNLNNVIDSLLQLKYPNYHVYVVADDCEGYSYHKTDNKLSVLHPVVVLKNQIKSHFYAIDNFVRPHNIVTIIDSDNIVQSNYLNGLEVYFRQGFQAVQGVRKAKNHNTVYACLDAINELYYLLYDRIVLFGIGSSAMLSGSGMAFTTELYRECLGNSNSSGAGFDKVLQNKILSRNLRIAFAKDAVVYDEKTADPNQLVKQRARWNNTWFKYFHYSLNLMWKGIKSFSINQFLYGFILFRPPLFILVTLCCLMLIINLFTNISLAIVWSILLVVFVIGFINALIKLKAEKKLYMALLHIPKFMVLQFASLFKAKKANELSVATEHSYHLEPEKK